MQVINRYCIWYGNGRGDEEALIGFSVNNTAKKQAAITDVTGGQGMIGFTRDIKQAILGKRGWELYFEGVRR
ncbi:hypothetical protein ACFSJU_18500 [Paradesertivirga mongoliensis]|uniref:Uncharacterized protein n=1 Tax=Paradesertivirga mongoliensis TaxID=2100740 RepID=A0ABW4ZQT0_9SPHI|nr:hypothetical protein [Pedobacter mongoliensis]